MSRGGARGGPRKRIGREDNRIFLPAELTTMILGWSPNSNGSGGSYVKSRDLDIPSKYESFAHYQEVWSRIILDELAVELEEEWRNNTNRGGGGGRGGGGRGGGGGKNNKIAVSRLEEPQRIEDLDNLEAVKFLLDSDEFLRQGEFPIEIVRTERGFALLDAHKHAVLVPRSALPREAFENSGRDLCELRGHEFPLFWCRNADVRGTMQRLDSLQRLKRNPICEKVLRGYCEPLDQAIISNENLDCHERAVDSCIAGSPGLYQWQGPPGTGKTKAIAHLVAELLIKAAANDATTTSSSSSSRDIKMLISSHSNRAVENVLDALLRENVPRDDIAWIVSSEHLRDGVPEHLEGLIDVRGRRRHRARVHVSTCARAFDIHSGSYHYIVLDEAAFCPEPDGLLPMSWLKEDGKFVMVGDQAQLPPVLRATRGSQPHGSLMGRCCVESLPSCMMFNVTYRVGPVSAGYLSQTHYKTIPDFRSASPHVERDPRVLGTHWLPEITFVDVPSSFEARERLSYKNEHEGQVILNFVSQLVNRERVEQKDIAVVTGYTAQQAYLRDLLRQNNLRSVLVTTVHAMQGSERRVVLLSTVRTRGAGFLDDEHLQCVATSRQKVFLIVVGSRQNLVASSSSASAWGAFFKYLEAHDLVIPYSDDITTIWRAMAARCLHADMYKGLIGGNHFPTRFTQALFWSYAYPALQYSLGWQTHTPFHPTVSVDLKENERLLEVKVVHQGKATAAVDEQLAMLLALHQIRAMYMRSGTTTTRWVGFSAETLKQYFPSHDQESSSIPFSFETLREALWMYRREAFGRYCVTAGITPPAEVARQEELCHQFTEILMTPKSETELEYYLMSRVGRDAPEKGTPNAFELKHLSAIYLDITARADFLGAIRKLGALRRSPRISAEYLEYLIELALCGMLDTNSIPQLEKGPVRRIRRDDLEVDEESDDDNESNDGEDGSNNKASKKEEAVNGQPNGVDAATTSL
eukprot:PhM_4_TR16440/c0_g1_i2/m.861